MAKGKDPFAELEKLRASLPPGPAAPAAATPATAKLAKEPAPPRAVVRMERKGRGGKEVTVVALTRPAPPGRGGGSGSGSGSGNDKLALPPAELERWCRDLKQALGCGGTVDGDQIVLQGDLRPRIGAVLEARGAGRVTIG